MQKPCRLCFALPRLSFEIFSCTQLIEMFQQQRLEAREIVVAPDITKPNSEEIIGSATTFTEHFHAGKWDHLKQVKDTYLYSLHVIHFVFTICYMLHSDLLTDVLGM